MSGLYTRLISNFIFPIHEVFKGHRTRPWLNTLEKSQWLSTDEILNKQFVDLKSLLRESFEHSPYYRALMSTYDFNPEEVQSLSDLQKLPLLTKSIIRKNRGIIKYSHAGKLTQYQTGGSSGEPLQFYVSKNRIAHDVAAKWRATRWWGVDIGDKEIVVWGSGIECEKQSKLRSLRDKLLRSCLIPARNLTPKKMDKILRDIEVFKPSMLFGYPSILSHLAQHAQSQGKNFQSLNIKVAFVTSEVLDEKQKQLIQSVFCCPVANGYGGRDAGFIAHECPEGNMHLTSEDIVVEILDESHKPVSSGEVGEIVVTHLRSQGFPFIRYSTGDLGVMQTSPCACGRHLPILKDIVGRTSDLIYSESGAVIHRAEIVKPITDQIKIEKFQFIQKSYQHALLRIKGQTLEENEQNQLLQNFKSLLGESTSIDIVYVDEIQPESSGKYKFVMSEIVN